MKKKIKWIILSLAIPLLVIIGYYSYSIIQFGINIHKPVSAEKHIISNPGPDVDKQSVYEPPEWEGKERVNILLLGGDGRDENDAGRSDSILVVSIDPVTKQAHLFSILRDSYVAIPGYSKNKINAALAFGGPQLALKTVSDFIGLPIHYYFYLDLESFIPLVDAIGGVDLEVEKDMKYTDTADKEEYQIDLKKGIQHLDGRKSLQYVRFRNDAMSDYSRTERQRKFLTAMAEKLQTTSTIIHLPGILDKIEPYIQTNMDLNDMVKMAVLLYKIRGNAISTAQLPPMKLLKEETIKGAAVITVDQKQLTNYIEQQLNNNN